ncbi:MAG TPA: hypothetical protein VFO39_10590 [Candidatus Sulfotelmatobacter sp.]|nr:hypothetical protein [Candidatus Sulfotelmatobacter sp.]
MADSKEYVTALEKALGDLENRVQTRDILNAEIAGLRETVRVLSSLVGIPADKQKRVALLLATVDSATPTLTDAIRSLLTRSHPQEMTATEIRNALEESNFNFGDFSNPLSACHSALKRLESDEHIERGKAKDGKTSYRAVVKLEPGRPTIYDVLLAKPPSHLTVWGSLMEDTKKKK